MGYRCNSPEPQDDSNQISNSVLGHYTARSPEPVEDGNPE